MVLASERALADAVAVGPDPRILDWFFDFLGVWSNEHGTTHLVSKTGISGCRVVLRFRSLIGGLIDDRNT